MLLGYRELLTQHILVGPSTKCVYGSLIIYISTSQIGPFSPQVFLFFSFFGYKPTSLDFTYHAWNPWNPTTQSTGNYLYHHLFYFVYIHNLWLGIIDPGIHHIEVHHSHGAWFLLVSYEWARLSSFAYVRL